MCRRFGTYGIKSHLSTRTDVNQVLSFGCYSAIIVAVKEGGLGRSITTLTPDNIVTVFKVTASLSTCFSALTLYQALEAVSVLWCTTVATVQMAILSLYLRIFKVVRWHQLTCYAAMAVVISWWASMFVT